MEEMIGFIVLLAGDYGFVAVGAETGFLFIESGHS
jgi:hypothetical protein